MSDEKKRTLNDVNNEYTALCAQAGQKQYQLECAKADLKALNEAIKQLNVEAAKMQQDELAAKKAAEEAAQSAPTQSNVSPLFEGATANA